MPPFNEFLVYVVLDQDKHPLGVSPETAPLVAGKPQVTGILAFLHAPDAKVIATKYAGDVGESNIFGLIDFTRGVNLDIAMYLSPDHTVIYPARPKKST